MGDIDVNGGVRAQSGFALQRNTALYILLNDYHTKYLNSNYFLCLEHHDDFVFCFQDSSGDTVLTEAYQSKKKSPHRWTVNQDLVEILIKLLQTGIRVRKDITKNTSTYSQNLYFTSNTSVFIESQVSENVSVDEENTLVRFRDLDPIIRDEMIKKFQDASKFDPLLEEEYDNLRFLYIELPRTAKEQRNLLTGKLGEVFGSEIHDRDAAIETIFSLFQKIELVYNQQSATFLDESKKVTGHQISLALKLITTKSKAFDYWRSEKKEIASRLNIKPFERDSFESTFVASFDFFKSLSEAEHQKILKFTAENYMSCTSTAEENCVLELFDLFKSTRSTKLRDLELKSVLYAAYFQVTYKQGA